MGHAVGAQDAHPSPSKGGQQLAPARSSAPGDLRAMRGAGRDPSGSAIPSRGLGFTQEGQGDAGRKWSNPSPSAGGDLVTKPNGVRRPRKDRARGDRLSRCWAGQGTRQQHPLGMVPYPVVAQSLGGGHRCLWLKIVLPPPRVRFNPSRLAASWLCGAAQGIWLCIRACMAAASSGPARLCLTVVPPHCLQAGFISN